MALHLLPFPYQRPVSRLRHTFWCGLVLPSAAAMTIVPVNYRLETANLFLCIAYVGGVPELVCRGE